MVEWICPINTAHRFSPDQAAFDRYRAHFDTQHSPRTPNFSKLPQLGIGTVDILASRADYFDTAGNFVGSILDQGLAPRFGLDVNVVRQRGVYVSDIGGSFLTVLDVGTGFMFFAMYVITPAGNRTDEALTANPHRVRIYHGIFGQSVNQKVGGSARNGVAQSMAMERSVNRILLTRYGATVNKMNAINLNVRGFV